MRFIDKKLANQPKELIAYKKTTKPTYANFQDKEILREALLKEQGFLCGYCMCRIENDSLKTKIEHYQEQCNFGEKSLDFDNMLAVCCGVLDNETKNPICDTKRGQLKKTEQSLQINPFDKSQMDKISFENDGRISVGNPTSQADLDEKLNLNHDILKTNRKKAIAEIQKIIAQKFPSKILTKAFISEKVAYYNNFDESDKLKPFCQVYIYWLKQRESKAI